MPNEKKSCLSLHLFVLLSVLSNKRFNIWIVDDDADDRELFVEAIADIAPNVKVSPIKNGTMLMERLENASYEMPDIIFLDINMPQKSGLECLKELRSIDKFKDVALVMYSTTSNPKQIDETYNIGANLYTRKPSNFNEIKSLLHKILLLKPDDYFPQPSRDNFLLN